MHTNKAKKRQGVRDGLDWAKAAGIMDATQPESFITREEAARMITAALEYFFGQIIRMLEQEESIP